MVVYAEFLSLRELDTIISEMRKSDTLIFGSMSMSMDSSIGEKIVSMVDV